MICSGHTAAKKRRLTTIAVTVVTAMSLCEGMASAQVRVETVGVRPGASDVRNVEPPGDTSRQREARRLQPIRDSLRTIDYGPIARQSTKRSAQAGASGRTRSVGRKILGGAIGATAGFFAGGYLGAAIEGDRCHCDDPGLKGALIGAPVGAVTGGILGALFF
jgi:hypothetical protein